MPRKPTQPPEPIESLADTDAIQHDMDVARADASRLHYIEIMYGNNDGALFDLEASIARIRSTLDAAAEMLLAGGQELIRIKERLPFGEFEEVVTERLGLSLRTAQNMMQAAAKFLTSTPRGKLATTLSRSKLLELLTEPDEALDELAEGGTLGNATLDQIECMTIRELRAALRTERAKRAEDTETGERLLEDKNKKIDKLATALDRRDHAPVDERLEMLRLRIHGFQVSCIAQVNEYDAIAEDIAAIDYDERPRTIIAQLTDTANLIISALDEVRISHGIPLINNMVTDPVYEAELEAAGLRGPNSPPVPPPADATAKRPRNEPQH